MPDRLGKRTRVSREVHMSVSEDELYYLQQLAEKSGCDSIANFFRLAVNTYAGEEIMRKRYCNNMYVKREVKA